MVMIQKGNINAKTYSHPENKLAYYNYEDVPTATLVAPSSAASRSSTDTAYIDVVFDIASESSSFLHATDTDTAPSPATAASPNPGPAALREAYTKPTRFLSSPNLYSLSAATHKVIRQAAGILQEASHPSRASKDTEQLSDDPRHHLPLHVVSGMEDALFDSNDYPSSNLNDSSDPKPSGFDSESSNNEQDASAKSTMDSEEMRRRLALSSQALPLVSVFVRPVPRLAVDFGLTWLPKNWSPHADPPLIDHVQNEWNQVIEEGRQKNAVTESENAQLRRLNIAAEIKINDLDRRAKIQDETEVDLNRRRTAIVAEEEYIAKKRRESDAVLESVNEIKRRVKKQWHDKTMQELGRDFYRQTSDHRSILARKNFVGGAKDPTPALLPGLSGRRMVNIFGLALTPTVYLTSTGTLYLPGHLAFEDEEQDQQRRCRTDHDWQFGTQHTRFIEGELRRRGRYGLTSRSPSPVHRERMPSPSAIPAAIMNPTLTQETNRPVASSIRRAHPLSDRRLPYRGEDRVSRVAEVTAPVRSTFVQVAVETESQPSSIPVARTSDPVDDAVVGLLRLDLVTSSVLTPSLQVHLDAVEADPSAQVATQTAAEDTEIVALVEQDASVASVSSGKERCDVGPPVPESATDSVEIVLQPQPNASGETTVTNEVINNAQILHEEVVEVSAPQQPLDHTAATFEVVNDAAVGLQPGLAVDSVFDTPANHPKAGDAATSEPPVQMLAQMATKDTEIVSPVQEEASISTVSCNPTPGNVELPVSESAIDGVENRPEPESHASEQTTVASPVSNNAQVSWDEEKEQVEVSAPIQRAPTPSDPVLPSAQPQAPSRQLDASVQVVYFCPVPAVTDIPPEEKEDDLASVKQVVALPDAVVDERVVETLGSFALLVPTSSVVATETELTSVENTSSSAALVVQLQTPMDAEDVEIAETHPELSTAMDVEQPAPSSVSVDPHMALTDLVIVERVRRSLEALVLPVRSTSLVVSMETQLAHRAMENAPQAVILAAKQTPMDVEDVTVAEAQSAISVAMDVEDESAPSLLNQLFTTLTEIEHATGVAEEVEVAMQEMIVETDGVIMERDDATLEMESARLELASKDATLEMEMKDATIEGEDEHMGNDDRMAETSAPGVPFVHQTQMEVDPGLKTPEEPGNTSSNDARPSEPTAQPSTVLHYPPFIPPFPKLSVFSGPQFLPSVTNFPIFSLHTLPPPSTSTSEGNSTFEVPATPTALAAKSTVELSFKVPVVSKNVSKPRHPNMVKKPCLSRPINPSQPAVELEVPQDASMKVGLTDGEEMKPWEIEKARTQALVDLLKKEKSESATSAANVDIPMEPSPASIPTAPSPVNPSAKPPPGLVRRVNSDGRTVFVPIRSRFKPTKPKTATSAAIADIPMEPSPASIPTAPSPANPPAKPPPANPSAKPPPGVVRRINSDGRIVFIPIRSRFKPTKPKPMEPATSLPTTSAASAPASSDIANEKSVTANVPAPKEKTYLPWEHEKASTKVVMEILGEQLAAEAQTYGQSYRPLSTALPVPSTAEVPVQQEVADNTGGEPMTTSEDTLANDALQQAQTLGERQVRSLPTRQRRPVGPTEPSLIANQQNIEALSTNSPLNVSPPAATDAFPVFSNADESQVVDDDNGSMNGIASPADLDTPTDEDTVNDPFDILVALSDVNAVPQTDNHAEGGPDSEHEPLSDDDNLWSFEGDYPT
ncbi:hypothetical protein QFC22_006356 [Naganishia vaughanmartiniae]|uniref:Uncharacterized protein n=1 Tax=Naganishia vaughanmartiniae TaxID=1424756 RepID=A0ACC2WLX1_9TREE|nr:hypothetical protein QFC22_006356 [Naganishia vaughanmartiniae]